MKTKMSESDFLNYILYTALIISFFLGWIVKDYFNDKSHYTKKETSSPLQPFEIKIEYKHKE